MDRHRTKTEDLSSALPMGFLGRSLLRVKNKWRERREPPLSNQYMPDTLFYSCTVIHPPDNSMEQKLFTK